MAFIDPRGSIRRVRTCKEVPRVDVRAQSVLGVLVLFFGSRNYFDTCMAFIDPRGSFAGVGGKVTSRVDVRTQSVLGVLVLYFGSRNYFDTCMAFIDPRGSMRGVRTEKRSRGSTYGRSPC